MGLTKESKSFFFQAEDGIRATSVTGVQTCALPILSAPRSSLNSSQPQNSPTRLLVFHSGNAMESPTLRIDRKSTRLNSSHRCISYAVFCLKKKKQYNADCEML